MPANHQLFVYGTLRKDLEHPVFHYIGKYFHFVSYGKVKGRLYDLGDYPGAVPADKDQYIIGEIFAINEADEFDYAIGQLDDYEGINPAEGASLYRRETTTIYTENGTAEAWVYWYNGVVAGMPVITSGDIMNYIKERC